MGWSSATLVVRVPQATRDTVWKQICALTPPPSCQTSEADRLVCCYALQGTCRFGPTCEYSHDVEKARLVGCQFGPKCKMKHRVVTTAGEAADLAHDLAKASAASKTDTKTEVEEDGDFSINGSAKISESLRIEDGQTYIECWGPTYDDSDPLWEEVAIALRKDDEDVGDGDLPTAARIRLANAGHYWVVDDDKADEWISMPAHLLLEHLESKQERLHVSRLRWLGDDISDARGLWDEVCSTVSQTPGQDESSPLKEADALLRKVFLLGSPLPSGASPLPAAKGNLITALTAAKRALTSLRKKQSVITGLKLPSSMGMTASGFLDDDLMGKIMEIRSCLERCICVKGYLEERETQTGPHSQSSDQMELLVGSTVEVMALSAPAEESLNGQHGELERYDQAAGLWQVRLVTSGTRLLLSEKNVGCLRNPEPEAAAPGQQRDHSRSPRRQEGHRSAQELVRAAAKAGDHVLIHHIVGWYGVDAAARPTKY